MTAVGLSEMAAEAAYQTGRLNFSIGRHRLSFYLAVKTDLERRERGMRERDGAEEDMNRRKRHGEAYRGERDGGRKRRDGGLEKINKRDMERHRRVMERNRWAKIDGAEWERGEEREEIWRGTEEKDGQGEIGRERGKDREEGWGGRG